MILIWLEELIADDGSKRTFAHIKSDRVFGNALEINTKVPKGAWVTVPSNLQPAIDWYLTQKCDFEPIGFVELDGEISVVLEKV